MPNDDDRIVLGCRRVASNDDGRLVSFDLDRYSNHANHACRPVDRPLVALYDESSRWQ